MATRRFRNNLRSGPGLWVGWLLLLLLAACGVANQSAVREPASNPPTHTPDSAPTAGPAATPIPAATRAAWQTYQSASGAYLVEYPVGWTVQEQADLPGAVTTTFRPSSNGAGIIVAVQPTQPDQQEGLDLPNTRCQQVSGKAGTGTRCLDTIALTTSTTFRIQGRTYTISTGGKGMDGGVYQHMLDSFEAASPATGPSQADFVSLLLQAGDLPDTIAGLRADDPAPLNFVNDPPADRIDGLRLIQAEREAGSASVLLYEKPTDLTQAYQRLRASVLADAGASSAPLPTPAIGEQAIAARLALASSTYGTNHVVVVVFVRCRALIDIRLNELASLTMDQALAYAKHLDQRIATLACA